MDLLTAAILGMVQGLTEFLPVSSSGHLVLGQALLGVETDGGAAFEVAVHAGTLLSVLLLFRREVLGLIRAVFTRGRKAAAWGQDPELRLAGAIIIGCVPAGLVGVLFKDDIEAAFGSASLAATALLGTGVFLLLTKLAKPGDGAVGPGSALLIGIAQAVAILPGVSRSGSTIGVALFLGIEREAAARYSFLMSLPVIAGATALKGKDLLDAPPSAEMLAALGVGAVVSFVVGVASLSLLLGVVRRGWFSHFGWYCLAAGATALAFL